MYNNGPSGKKYYFRIGIGLLFTIILLVPCVTLIQGRGILAPPTSRRSSALTYVSSLRNPLEPLSETYRVSTTAELPSIQGASDVLIVASLLDPINSGFIFDNKSETLNWLAFRQNIITTSDFYGGFADYEEDQEVLDDTYNALKGLTFESEDNIQRAAPNAVMNFINHYRDNATFAYQFRFNMSAITNTTADYPSIGATLMAIQALDFAGILDDLTNKTALIDWVISTQNPTSQLFGETPLTNASPSLISVSGAIQILTLLDSTSLLQSEASTLANWILDHQYANGGFSLDLNPSSGIALSLDATYSALNALADLDQLQNPGLNTTGLVQWILSLQQENGGFIDSISSLSEITSSRNTRLAVEILDLVNQLDILDETVPWETLAITPVEILVILSLVGLGIGVILIVRYIYRMDYP